MRVLKKSADATVRTAVRIMEQRNYSGIKFLMDVVEGKHTVPIPRDEQGKIKENVLNSMLMTDYEYTPDGQALQSRLRIRVDLALELLAYQFSKQKSADQDRGSGSVNVFIKQYGPGSVEVANVTT
jgi:hypothetical protein